MTIRPLFRAVIAASLLALGTPTAGHASGTTFRGGCGFAALTNNPTPIGLLGDPDTWTGLVYLAVVPVSSAGVPNGSPVTATCYLEINGVSAGTVLGPASGIGVVATLGPVTYTAEGSDVVRLCTSVTTPVSSEVVCKGQSAATLGPVGVFAVGSMNLSPIPLPGSGSGTWSFQHTNCLMHFVGLLPQICTIDASGTYLSVICGMGSATGNGVMTGDPRGPIPFSVTIVYDGPVALLSGTWQMPDGPQNYFSGAVGFIPVSPPSLVNCPTDLLVAGVAASPGLAAL